MAQDPAFLFYPGDYLRDTQLLSLESTAIYMQIACYHMKNICLTQGKLNLFIKSLSEEDKIGLIEVLHKNEDQTYQIKWVTDSIEKRRKYSESRRNNRKKKENNSFKKDKHISNISKTYVHHMENENENENVIKKEIENKIKFFDLNLKNLESRIGLSAMSFLISSQFEIDIERFKILAEWLEWQNKNHRPVQEMQFLKLIHIFKKHETSEIQELIDLCISSKWQSIVWEKIKKNESSKNNFERPGNNVGERKPDNNQLAKLKDSR